MKRILIALCTLAAPVAADGTMNGVPIDCFCTDKGGQRIEVGETICLQVDGRMFMAQCQMSLNVPMWREVATGCLSSSLRAPLQSTNPLIHAGGVDTEVFAPKS